MALLNLIDRLGSADLSVSEFDSAQSKGIRDNRDGGEAHRRRRNHRRQQKAK